MLKMQQLKKLNVETYLRCFYLKNFFLTTSSLYCLYKKQNIVCHSRMYARNKS